MGRILATFATILILLLAAAFALPAIVDWNSYRSTIEEMASGVLGRKVSIVGNIGIELLPEPHLRANNIAAGNGKADAVLLTASAADISLSLEALLGGRLDASHLKLVHPVLMLDFSKPFAEAGDARTLGAGVGSVEIEDGRISVFSRHGGGGEAVALTGLNGTASASPSGNALRFGGRMLRDGRSYEVKFQVSQQERGVRLEGTATEPASKSQVHADGFLSVRPAPVFEGTLAVNMPQAAGEANRLPFDLQAKSTARIGLSDAKLTGLELTLDSQGRTQVLTGAATIAFNAGAAALSLNALSLDADAMLAGSNWAAAAAPAPGDWSGLAAAADKLMWLYPGYVLNLGLEAGQIQLRGELIEAVKLHGKRSAGRWLFDEVAATLPGESALKVAGTLAKQGQESRLTASVAVEGRSLGRLARWLMPAAVAGGRLPLGAYSIKGSLTLSPEVSAFEGITGKLDGTPFTAGLHLGKAPARGLQASLSGDHFDLTSFEGGDSEAMPPAEGLKNLWQAGLARLTAALGNGDGFDTADIDISAGGIKVAGSEAKNVALHLKYGAGLITVSKLSAETMNGLTLKAEGSVPLGGASQGRFGGRIEARSPEAVVQAAVLAGFDSAAAERRAAYLAPAALTVSYTADASGPATARLDGNLGQARVEGHAEFRGSLSDWSKTELSAQLKLSEPDGNKLAALFFPKAVAPAGAASAPGALSVSLNGNPRQLQTQASLSAGALQAQLDGSTALKPLSFQGKASVLSPAPEQFLPSPLLALLGGEPGAVLRVSANVTADSARIEARDLSAEAPGNAVTGRLAIGMGAVTRIDADLKAGSIALPSVLSYFLSTGPGDTFATVLPSSLTSQPPPQDIWNGRPFAIATFKETGGAITLAAKTMKLGDTVAVSGASLRATLGKDRLDIESLTGKTLGGTLDAALSLTARDNVIAAQGALTLSGADLAALAAPGTPPLVNGQATISLKASGQGMSPRGLISVLRGRGAIRLAGGHLSKLTPYPVQARADELLAQSLPLTEDAVTKTVAEAAQSKDFKFHKLAIPVRVADGILEIRRASFRDGEATVRMEGFIDLNKALVDSTWQMGVSSDRRQKGPPVKLTLAGPLRELGARPRTPAAEDFVRAILIRKMEGDITRLEGMNGKPAGPAPAKPAAAVPAKASVTWSASQQPAPAPKKPKRKKEEQPASVSATEPTQPKSFEQRMRDTLDNIGGSSAR